MSKKIIEVIRDSIRGVKERNIVKRPSGVVLGYGDYLRLRREMDELTCGLESKELNTVFGLTIFIGDVQNVVLIIESVEGRLK